jgi:hypothetical protein
MQCPHCHLTIPDAAQTAGQTVACPRCASQFVASGGGGEQFDPYYTWLGIPPNEQPANHYRLLGIQLFEANSNVIENAADRQMKHLQSYKIGAKAALSQRLLTEVSAARVQLLDPARKAVYDAELRSRASASPMPHLPQLPEAGTPFTALADSTGPPPITSRSGVRRLSRRSNSASLLSTLLIVVGGSAGLIMGAVIIFYVTGQNVLELSGKQNEQPQQTASTPSPTQLRPTTTIEESPIVPAIPPTTETPPAKPLEKPKTKTIVKSPTPQVVEPAPVVEEPKPPAAPSPDSLEIFSSAPRFLKLPQLASSASYTLFSLSRDPAEPLTLVLHTEAATLPAGANFRIRADESGSSWTVEQSGDSSAANSSVSVQNIGIAHIRLNGRELTFAWSGSTSETEIRRQLANCLLEITCGSEFRNLQLREPLFVPAIAIDFDHEKQQSVELNVSDTPATSKLLVRFKELEGFSRGAKIRGENDTGPFIRPLEIQFADIKGPEIEFRFVRQTNGKLVMQVKPQFVEAANRKFDLTVPSLEKITRAQEKIRAEAQDTLVKAQSNLASAQSTLQSLNNNRPTDVQGQIAWNSRVSTTMTAINHLSGVIASATEKRAEAQARLNAVPEIRSLIEAHKAARIKFQIVAKADAGEIILVDGTSR